MNAMSRRPMFDELAYVDTLKEGGLDEKQARAQSRALTSALSQGVATNEGLTEVRHELKTEIVSLRHELKSDIAGLRTELKAGIAELRTELKTEIAELRTELKTDIFSLRTELKTECAELRSDIKTMGVTFDTKLTRLENVLLKGALLMTLAIMGSIGTAAYFIAKPFPAIAAAVQALPR
jgi:ribosomal protein L29